jgi:hypothetical protein
VCPERATYYFFLEICLKREEYLLVSLSQTKTPKKKINSL